MVDRIVHSKDLDTARGLAEDGSKAFVKIDGTTIKFNTSGQLTAGAAGKLTFGAANPASAGTVDGEEYFVTSDGTSAGTISAQWIWDQESSAWLKRPTPISTPITTSLTPVVYDGGWVGAQADIAGNLAKEVKLSDGTIIASGLVTWTGHGLTVGETYYTSQTTAGAYVTPEPTSGLSQKLFTVIDANTIDIQVQEGIELSSSGPVLLDAVDHASSGYFDIGTMRIQWGRKTTTATTGSIALPAAFANNTYSVTTTVVGSNTGVAISVQLGAKTTTAFAFTETFSSATASGLAGEPFDWIAVGLKP